MEKIKKPIGVDRNAYPFFYGGFFLFIFEFLLDLWKDNPIISSDNISHSLSEINYSLFLEG